MAELGLHDREVGCTPTSCSVALAEAPAPAALRVAVESWSMGPAVAVNATEVLPAGTTTDCGIETAGSLPESSTAKPPAGAGCDDVTWHAAGPPPTIRDGLQASVRSIALAGRRIWKANVRLSPPAVAVTVADCCATTAETVAANVQLAEPAGTVTEAGTPTAVLLLARPTLSPAFGAGWLSVSVQSAVAGPASKEGLHVSPLSSAFAEMSTATVCDWPPAPAVTAAIKPPPVVEALTGKLALLNPGATRTVAGTVRAAWLLEMFTAVPPPCAALVRVAVQLAVPPGITLGGQLRDNNCVGVITSSEKVRVSELPLAVI